MTFRPSLRGGEADVAIPLFDVEIATPVCGLVRNDV